MSYIITDQEVKFDREALKDFQEYVKSGNFSKMFFLVDENTHEKCLIPLLQALEELPENEVLEIEPGEESKSPEVLFQLWMALSERKADRHSLLVNVGGGVVTDLGGFLAGTYMRGIPFVNFPTTVLSQVDASVGGKTGINLENVKNKVGLFLNPERVYIINDFLKTLPLKERRSGYAEMLKHGLIADAVYWKELTAVSIGRKLPHAKMIQRSIAIKSGIVQQDFKEKGLRKILNFGHTLGHALETAALEEGEPLLHGEAIALGMIGELWLSAEYAGMSGKESEKAVEVLKGIYDELEVKGSIERLIELVKQDKKNRKEEISFTLLKCTGEAVTDVIVPENKVYEVFAKLQKL